MRLEALSILSRTSAWRLVDAAFQTYFDGLPETQQKAVSSMIELMTSHDQTVSADPAEPLPPKALASVAG
jgi:hypothetical protein